MFFEFEYTCYNIQRNKETTNHHYFSSMEVMLICLERWSSQMPNVYKYYLSPANILANNKAQRLTADYSDRTNIGASAIVYNGQHDHNNFFIKQSTVREYQGKSKK